MPDIKGYHYSKEGKPPENILNYSSDKQKEILKSMKADGFDREKNYISTRTKIEKVLKHVALKKLPGKVVVEHPIYFRIKKDPEGWNKNYDEYKIDDGLLRKATYTLGDSLEVLKNRKKDTEDSIQIIKDNMLSYKEVKDLSSKELKDKKVDKYIEGQIWVPVKTEGTKIVEDKSISKVGAEMVSVTESSLNLAAHEIVADFNHNDVTLNDGVIKKAAELGLNDDQTSRLIERANSEAFLSLFPDTADFTVADPSVVFEGLKTKVASTEKVANEVKFNPSYAEQLERDPYEIFGIEPAVEKTASQELKTSKEVIDELVALRAQSEALDVEKVASFMLMEEADSKMWNAFKDEVLSGRSVSSIEKELVLSYPEKVASVCIMISALTDKIAAYTKMPMEAYDRLEIEDINPNEVIFPSDITNAFKGVLDYAST